MNRITWIDHGKAIAIFCVVWLHVHCDPTVTRVINGFIMPLFFIMSGFLFSYDRNPSYRRFAWKRFRQLVVPYLWINIVAWIAWVTVLRHFGSNGDGDIAWHMPLTGIIAGIPPMLTHDIPLWSLLSFYVVEMIFYPLCKVNGRPFLIAAGALAVNLLMWWFFSDHIARLPLALGPSVAGVCFYAVGFGCRRLGERPDRLFRPLPTVLAAIVFAAAIHFNSNVDFYICNYGDYALYMLSSICGSYVVMSLCHSISRAGLPSGIRFISESTLIICGFHLMAFAALKGVGLFLFGIQPEQLTAGAVRGLLFAIAALALTLPPAWFIRRYLRPLVDK